MGMGGGSTTTTTSNVPFNSQELNTVQQGAINLGQSNPLNYTPYQTWQAPNDIQNNAVAQGGYWANQAGNNTSAMIPGMQQQAMQLNQGVAGGSFLNSIMPWINQQAVYGEQNPAQQGINNLNQIGAGQAYRAAQPITNSLAGAASGPGGNVLNSIAGGQYMPGSAGFYNPLAGVANGTAVNDLARSANGDFLNSNPYLTGMFNAASQPVVSAFQTAVAPGVDSRVEAAGRFGSGLNSNAQSQAQQNLGTTLNNLSSNIFGTDYANERGLMNQAAGTMGGLQSNALAGAGGLYQNAVNTMAGSAANLGNLNVSGLSNAGNVLNNAADSWTRAATNQGMLGAQGQSVMNQSLNSALGNYSNYTNQMLNAGNNLVPLSNVPLNDYQQAMNSGNWLQQQQQANLNDQNARFMGNQAAPWQTLQTEAGIVGSGIPGMSAVTSPFSTNPLGGIASGLNGMNALGGLGGSGGMFGAGGMLGSQGPLFGSLADASIAAGGPPLALSATAADAGGMSGLSMLPMMALK